MLAQNAAPAVALMLSLVLLLQAEMRIPRKKRYRRKCPRLKRIVVNNSISKANGSTCRFSWNSFPSFGRWLLVAVG